MSSDDPTDRLDSWKEIAAYLNRSERTVRRWEETESLPVYRHTHQQRGSVWALRSEIDVWRQSRVLAPAEPANVEPEEESEAATQVLATATSSWRISTSMVLFGMALILSAIGLFLIIRRPSAPKVTAFTPVPFTTLPGFEMGASFSPNGNAAVFFHGGALEKPIDRGLYIKSLDQETITPLTTGKLRFSPAWSPKGDRIAFIDRSPTGVTRLMWMPVGGGQETEVASLGLPLTMQHTHVTWSPDGRWLFAGTRRPDGKQGIFRYDPDSKEAVQITRIDPSAGRDIVPTISPDGKKLAFVRELSAPGYGGVVQVATLPLNPDFTAVPGEPTVIESGYFMHSGLAWAPSGEDLLFCSGTRATQPHLFRLTVRKPAIREQLGTDNCNTVTISRPSADGSASLIYGNPPERSSLFLLRLNDSSEPKPFAPSTRFDASPSYSVDGKQVIFISSRSGLLAYWITDAEGKHARRLDLAGLTPAGAMQASPDGLEWVFPVARPDGVSRIFTLNLGGVPREAAVGRSPFYSRNGMWIYFTAPNRQDIWHVWRIPRGGNVPPEQVTRTGGYMALEMPGGKTIASLALAIPSMLREVPVDGSSELHAIPFAYGTPIGSTKDWLYLVLLDANGKGSIVRTRSLAEKPEIVRRIDKSLNANSRVDPVAISPDGNHMIFSAGQSPDSDLVLVRNFR